MQLITNIIYISYIEVYSLFIVILTIRFTKKFMAKIDLNLKPVAFDDLIKSTGNIYDTINIISKRAKVLNTRFKTELDRLLEEFGSPSGVNDTSYLDECETICKSSDIQPKPHIQAIMELLEGDLFCKENHDNEECKS